MLTFLAPRAEKSKRNIYAILNTGGHDMNIEIIETEKETKLPECFGCIHMAEKDGEKCPCKGKDDCFND